MAQQMKEKMGDAVNLSIFTTDSMEAMKYKLKSSTSVFVNEEQLSLRTALSVEKMEEFLTGL